MNALTFPDVVPDFRPVSSQTGPTATIGQATQSNAAVTTKAIQIKYAGTGRV